MNLLLWLLLSSFLIFGEAKKLYPTNFMETFRWKSKQIHYGTPGLVSDVKFRNFVSNSINFFNDKFGNYFVWIFEEDAEDLKQYERYLVFEKTMLGPDGASYAKSWWPDTMKVFDEKMLRGQNTISITTARYNDDQIACTKEDVIRLILATLGFYPLTCRIDRDKHIQFRSRKNVFLENIPKRYDLANSTNPVFNIFDFSSIHMPSAVVQDHNAPSWPPIFVPVNNNTENWEAILNSDKSITETDVKQFQAIYHD